MVKNKMLISIAFSLVAIISYAQIPENKDARHMNYLMLLSVEDYCRTSSLYNDEYRQEFIKLFDDKKSSCIYNDFMNSSSFQQIISPEEYIRQYANNDDMMLETDYSDLDFVGPFEYRDGRWYRKVIVEKTIKIIDSVHYSDGAGGVLYDSSQLYPDAPSFSLEIELVYDKIKDRELISAIAVALKKPRTPLDEDTYSVIIKSDTKFDSRLESAGKSLSFNDFGEAFAYYNDYSVNDDDVKISASQVVQSDRYNVLKLKFTPKHLRLKLHADFAPFGAYSVSFANSGIDAKSTAKEVGIDLGFTFSVGNAKMGPFVGVAASMSEINFSMSNFSFSYPEIMVNRGVKMYDRTYNINEASEGLSMKDIVIPLYWEVEHRLGSWGKLVWDIGAKAYINGKMSWTSYNVSGSVTGVLEDHSVINDNVENCLGSFSQNFNSFISPVDYSRSQFDYSAFGKIGLDISTVKNLSVSLSAGYEYGINWSYTSSMAEYLNADKAIIPLLYSQSLNQNIAVHSFLGSVSYKRQGIWLSAGIKYKF